MTCHHTIKAWQNTSASLTEPSQIYYAKKKISFKFKKDWKEIEIPCNHCLGCKLDHADMWATRMTLESKCWKTNCFVTLTYNDPKLPLSEEEKTTLVKKHLQDFLKRLRYYEKGIETWTNPINQKEEQPIRYFACGEYGLTGTRAVIGGNPHYHLAIFNWKPKDLKIYKINKHGQTIYKSKSLQKIWGKGFVTIEDFNHKTASYIARYVQKKAGIEPQKIEYTGEFKQEIRIDERNRETYIHDINIRKIKKQDQTPEFITMSRGVGIGMMYWIKEKEKIKRNKGILLKTEKGTKLKPIPRYFKKLWEKENYQEFYRYKYEIEKEGIKRKAEIISRIKLPDGKTIEQKWEFYLQNAEKNLKERAKYLKRNEFI